MKFIDKIKKIFEINHNVISGEIEEIKELEVTEEDKEQGKELAVLVAATLIGCGIPCGALSQNIMAEVLAYAIRDLKDGVEVHDKLIIGRIVNEFSK